MSESELLDERYLAWLYAKVAPVDATDPSKMYWRLFKQLYQTEFIWWVGNDEDRGSDGIALRNEFESTNAISKHEQEWKTLPCSMLEMLIALSDRLAFNAGGSCSDWFWEMLDNIKLSRYNDASRMASRTIENVLAEVIWRTYRRNGAGGLFPLTAASEDQRWAEIWQQMSYYILENE